MIPDDNNEGLNEGRVMKLGDVGYFDREGGFEVLFNIYKTAEENRKLGYDPPHNFAMYEPPPNSLLTRSILKSGKWVKLIGDIKAKRRTRKSPSR